MTNGDSMKIFKIILLSILSIFAILYLAFLFVFPHTVDLSKYSPEITKLVQDNTGIQVELRDLKLKTAWNLSAGAFIKKTDLKYLTGEKFAQIDNLEVNVSLLPLLFKEIRVNKINADKILANIDISKQEKDFSSRPNVHRSHCKLSTNMPDISVKKYRISLLSKANNYTLKGEDTKISDFVLNEKIKIKSRGELILNKRKQIFYNVCIFSNVFPKQGKEKIDFIQIFEDLYKYNINANIDTDLKIQNKSDIEGKINVNKISFTFGKKTFPQSSLKLAFRGDKTKINSSLHVDENSKVIVCGNFRNGKHRAIDLQVISNQINIKDIILIAKTMSKPFGIKNIQDINAGGNLKADFKIKSDFKKVESSGYLKIQNANLTNNLYKVSLSRINGDVDFSKDSVQIKQAMANLNNQPITINGTIDKNANASILVLANNLQLKSVILASGNTKILKENDVLNGLISVKASLKGRLDKAIPQIKILVSNVNLKNKQSKTSIKIAKAIINSDYDKKTKRNHGVADIIGLNVYPSNSLNISAPKINLTFNEKELNIVKTYLYINNIKTDLYGKFSNLNSAPILNSINISIPNQISIPLKGYAGSSIVLKGTLTLNGDMYNPQIHGGLEVPSINIPTVATTLKNTTLQFDKDINVNCPQVQIANSSMNFNAHIDKNLQKGIIAKDVNFNSNKFDLNSLIPIFKNLPKNSSQTITILNGKNTIENFKVGRFVSNNVTSNIELKNNILHLDDLRADAYFGKAAGIIDYDFKHRRTSLNLQGRNMSANTALIALMGRDNDIHGQLDFDSNISIMGFSKDELLRSLKGNTRFIITNGKMGALGKFEHLLYAQNIISNSVFRATLNVIAKAVTVKNTGVYKYMKGKVAFSEGWANIDQIKTSGPSMSLYLTGRYYLPDNTANLIILGRISDDVVRILGPIGEFSMDKAISSIPKLGQISTFFASQITTNPSYENISQIPYLTPKTEFPTKEFKVVIDGDVQKQSSVKSFKWLSRPRIVQSSQIQKDIDTQQPITIPSTTIPTQEIPTTTIPDFVKKLPDLKY